MQKKEAPVTQKNQNKNKKKEEELESFRGR